MKLLTNLINQLFVKKPVVLLGRWNIVYCEKKINKKIDLSNEDHCGTCSNNDMIKDNKKQIKEYDAKSLIFFETM
jgi:hypothetical protein